MKAQAATEESRLGHRVPAQPASSSLTLGDRPPGTSRQPLSPFPLPACHPGYHSDYFLSTQWELMELLINMTRGRESKSHRVCARLCQEFAENMFVNV